MNKKISASLIVLCVITLYLGFVYALGEGTGTELNTPPVKDTCSGTNTNNEVDTDMGTSGEIIENEYCIVCAAYGQYSDCNAACYSVCGSMCIPELIELHAGLVCGMYMGSSCCAEPILQSTSHKCYCYKLG